MDKESIIYVAGATGLVGSAVVRKLRAEGYKQILTEKVDLLSYQETYDLFARFCPEYVFLCAAKVGGILANRDAPADFIEQNLAIQSNVIKASLHHNVEKLLFLGSSCIYPRDCPQPIREEYLLTGKLEETNSAYAIAKIAGIELLKAYRKQHGLKSICLMPTNLYGPNDNFDEKSSHVLPAMIGKMHTAASWADDIVTLWGTGSPKREFLHVDDLADACLFLMNNYDSEEIINVGCGEDISIKELAELVKEVVGFDGELRWDISKPDGTPRKLLDTTKINQSGWKPKISLREGIGSTYEWFKNQKYKPKVTVYS